MPKFRILPKVASFADAKGDQYKPGDVVELPRTYLGETWLEPVQEPKKAKAPVQKIEELPEISEEKTSAPLEKPKKSTRRKKS